MLRVSTEQIFFFTSGSRRFLLLVFISLVSRTVFCRFSKSFISLSSEKERRCGPTWSWPGRHTEHSLNPYSRGHPTYYPEPTIRVGPGSVYVGLPFVTTHRHSHVASSRGLHKTTGDVDWTTSLERYLIYSNKSFYGTLQFVLRRLHYKPFSFRFDIDFV